MATTTPNFGWSVPTSTDYVKDGAVAIETLGDAIDASLVDLKGGTTGQVLSKNTNTDMDFTWVTPNDADAIQNTIVDAKGDLIAATAADTPARLAVGSNGQVLTADSTTATGLKWATAPSGSMTLLASGSLSGASTALTSISGSYKDLRLVIRNGKPSTDGADINLRFNQDTTVDRHHSFAAVLSNGGSFDNTFGTLMSNTDNTTASNLLVVDIPDYANTNTWKFALASGLSVDYATTTNYDYFSYKVVYNQTAAITALTILVSAGTLTGDYFLYGVN